MVWKAGSSVSWKGTLLLRLTNHVFGLTLVHRQICHSFLPSSRRASPSLFASGSTATCRLSFEYRHLSPPSAPIPQVRPHISPWYSHSTLMLPQLCYWITLWISHSPCKWYIWSRWQVKHFFWKETGLHSLPHWWYCAMYVYLDLFIQW